MAKGKDLRFQRRLHMLTFRSLLPLAPAAVLAGAALVMISAASGQGRGSAPAQVSSPAAAPQAHPPAPTLTKPIAPTATPDVQGFIRRWLLLEPIPSTGLTQKIVQAEVKKEYFPDQFTVIPKDGDKVTVDGKELIWHAVDTKLYNVNLFHFARALGKPNENVLFWAVTIVNCPRDMQNVRLAIGSNAASVWWVNGEEVVGIYGDRQTVVDDGVSKRLTLTKGPNVVRAAIVNGGGATDFCARFLDSDDKPVKGIAVSLVNTAR
jgi:hypothetical protein